MSLRKAACILLNVAITLVCGFYRLSYHSVAALLVSVLFVLNMVSVVFWVPIGWVNAMILVNLCTACLVTITLGVVLARGPQVDAELSYSVLLALLMVVLITLLINLGEFVRTRRQRLLDPGQ